MSFNCFRGITLGVYSLQAGCFGTCFGSAASMELLALRNLDAFVDFTVFLALFFFLCSSCWESLGFWFSDSCSWFTSCWIVWRLLICTPWFWAISSSLEFFCSSWAIFIFSSLIYKSLSSWLAWVSCSSHLKRAAVLCGSVGSSRSWGTFFIFFICSSCKKLKCEFWIYVVNFMIFIKMDSSAAI